MQLLHCTTPLRYTNYTTLRYNYNCNCNYTCNYTTPVTQHHTTTTTTLHYTTLAYTTLYTTLQYTTLQHTTIQYTTIHYTNYTTPQLQLQLQLQLHYTYYTLQLQLHYTTPYNYNYNCTTPHFIQQLWVRWPLQPLQPLQKTQLQPPFGPSVDSLCHLWFTRTNLSYRFPIFETSATNLRGTTGKMSATVVIQVLSFRAGVSSRIHPGLPHF